MKGVGKFQEPWENNQKHQNCLVMRLNRTRLALQITAIELHDANFDSLQQSLELKPDISCDY